jgi:hypothetical protein
MADSVKDISQLAKIQLSPLPPLESWSAEMCQSVTDQSKCICVSGLNKQLQIFRFLCTSMTALSFFQDGVSGINNQLIIAFPLLVQDGVSSIYLQLLIFCCVRTNMATLLLTFQDGVSGVHKMTRYKDEGSLGKIFSNCLKFSGKRPGVPLHKAKNCF